MEMITSKLPSYSEIEFFESNLVKQEVPNSYRQQLDSESTCRSLNMSPPPYSPSVRHISIGYCLDEGAEIKTGGQKSFFPVIVSIESTKLVVRSLRGKLAKCVSALFDDLDPSNIDPDLNIKSDRARNVMRIRSYSILQPPRRNSLSHVLRLLPFRKRSRSTSSVTPVGKVCNELALATQLLNCKPLLTENSIVAFSPIEHIMESLQKKATFFGSWSLQELVKYGNACDYSSKAFALRLIFPSDQLLIASYNPFTFIQLFYKLNIAHELSLDLDLRVVLPTDYCTPRRRRRSVPTRLQSSSPTIEVSSTSMDCSHSESLSTVNTISSPFSEENLVDQTRPHSNSIESYMSLSSHSTSSQPLHPTDSSSLFSQVDRENTRNTEQPEGTETRDVPTIKISSDFDDRSSDLQEEILFAMRCMKNCRNHTKIF